MAQWQRVLWFGLGYFLCAIASGWVSAPGTPFVTFWIPSGLAVAVFLLSDSRGWPGLTLAMFAANLAFDLWQGTPVAVSLLFCVANALETVTSAWLVRRFIAPWPTLSNLRELIGLLALSVVLSPMLGAAIAAATLAMSGLSESFALSWFLWWTSEAMAIVLVTPFILTWWGRPSQDGPVFTNRWQVLEAAALVCVSLGMTSFVLMGRQGVLAAHRASLLLPLLWAALRFGPRGATVANLLLALPVAIATSQYSIGVRPEAVPGDFGPGLQIALVMGAMASLIPAVVFRSYDRTIQDLHDAALRIQALNARYAGHEAALTRLARAYVALPDNLAAVLKEITEVVARTLEVERVSIWRYDQGRTAIVCMELFESTAARHSSGLTLSARDYPAYFQALAQSDTIAAGDAHRDPRTAEFGEGYLRPLGITSMLDTPVRSQGAMVGIVCCEHVGPVREWAPDEQTFAVAVASLVSALLAQVERHQLEARLRQAQRMEAIGQLAGGVAHDFNNVLAVIQMQAGLLQDEPDLPPVVAESAMEIEKATERAANLTRQLLLFSRRETLQPRDLDLNGVVSHIAQMLQRILGDNIRLHVRPATEPLLIRADAGMMDQILMNLTVNSRDAMPGGGHLVIESSAVMCEVIPSSAFTMARPGPYVRLTVTDSGSGIPAEALPRIFEPFFTTKGVGKGTGLGLATVFGIVEQHLGWIDVESEPGRGTTFRVYLPRLLKSTDLRMVPVLHEESVRGGVETILVAEDDSALRLVVCNALTRLGYRVIEASNGVRALDEWRQHRDDISLLLTDMVMPGGVNGKELAETVLQENPALKVIYSSGYSAEVAGDHFPLVDGVNFLAKPFAVNKLAQMVRECLDRA